MAVIPGSILVAESTAGKLLDTVQVATTEGTVHREAIFIGDPATPGNRAAVTTGGELLTVILATINAAITNYPAIQPVSISSGSVGLTSEGSTKIVGIVQVNNPTTSVTISNPTTAVTVSNPTTAVTVSNPTTVVDLSSAGSTRVVGLVGQSAPPWAVTSTSVQLSSGTQTIGTVINSSSTEQIGSVALASGTTGIMGAFQIATGTTGTLGAVGLLAGSSANVVGSVALVAGTTANAIGSVALLAGTTANTIGSAALVAGSSANVLGSVTLAAGTSANVLGSVALTSGGGLLQIGTVALTSSVLTIGQLQRPTTATLTQLAFTTADSTAVSANANRLGLWLYNDNTQSVYIGLSTAVVSTLAYSLQIGSSAGFQFPVPCYTGAVHAKWAATASTVGSLRITEITS